MKRVLIFFAAALLFVACLAVDSSPPGQDNIGYETENVLFADFSSPVVLTVLNYPPDFAGAEWFRIERLPEIIQPIAEAGLEVRWLPDYTGIINESSKYWAISVDYDLLAFGSTYQASQNTEIRRGFDPGGDHAVIKLI